VHNRTNSDPYRSLNNFHLLIRVDRMCGKTRKAYFFPPGRELSQLVFKVFGFFSESFLRWLTLYFLHNGISDMRRGRPNRRRILSYYKGRAPYSGQRMTITAEF